ncbi:2-oxoacid:acceptor oxidoreductase family protein [Candidatus Woesearchaeota archaeon]|nr:2-oxoacid:acceptor oxidoreductase family protein [Candidatus Woesearchaeota archaeon]MBW3014123.1 2-oxoacid:acceptor oxidoreductase family protein [Candidatus Woesearchaeota archaeon]
MKKTIIISGEGGQGVKLIGQILGKILAGLGYEVSVDYSFDTAIRGGKIDAYLTFSDDKIDNPIIENADFFIRLSAMAEEGNGTVTICDSELCKQEKCDSKTCKIANLPFQKSAIEKFGNKVMMNMIVLGKILKMLDIDIDKLKFEKILPPKMLDQNIEALRYGFNLVEERN